MKRNPKQLAVSLYEAAVPIFVTLKEEISSQSPSVTAHPVVKELTFAQLRILMAIEHGRDQVGKLARGTGIAQPAMSRTVDNLINMGYVQRATHPMDRRQILLSLTAKGLEATDRIRSKAAERYVAAIEALSPQDLQTLDEGITVLLRVIAEARKDDV
jgi:DNA-binding MarR family transcriptional regulator